MKITQIFTTGLLALTLGGCIFAQADTLEFPDNVLEPVPLTEIEKSDKFSSNLIANFYKSCNNTVDQQLQHADQLMKQLYRIGYDKNRKKKLDPKHPVYEIGNDLYNITKQIYTHKLTAEKCQDLVIELNNSIVNSNIKID